MLGGGKPSGGVSSRFVSQTELEAAAATRASAKGVDESNEPYDPRSLFEQLQAHKNAKDEEYDDMYKLSNQFRGIDEGESDFLSQINQQKAQAERQKKQQEQLELLQFKQARSNPAAPVPLSVSPTPKQATPAPVIKATSSPATTDSSKSSGTVNKKKRKAGGSALLGIVQKKPSSSTPKPVSDK